MYPNHFYSFSFLNEKWTQLDDLPKGKTYHGSVKIKDSLYIVGGEFSSSIDRFDLNTRTFSTVNSLDENLCLFGVCQYDENNFMLAGGCKLINNDQSIELTDICYLYSVITNSFKQVGSLNKGKNGHVLVKNDDGEIYAVEGSSCTIEKFDTRLQIWTVIQTTLQRYGFGAVAYKNFIYLFGGLGLNGKLIDSIEKFDTRTGEIVVIQAKLKVPRCYFAIARYGQLAYIIGGEVTDYLKKPSKMANTKSVEIFNLNFETVEEGKSLPFEDSGYTAHVV